jgi:hypothetical protein
VPHCGFRTPVWLENVAHLIKSLLGHRERIWKHEEVQAQAIAGYEHLEYEIAEAKSAHAIILAENHPESGAANEENQCWLTVQWTPTIVSSMTVKLQHDVRTFALHQHPV